MKKVAAKRKTPLRRKKAGPRDLFAGVDMQLLGQFLAEATALEEKGLEDMVEAFLSAQPEDVEDMPDTDAISDLAEALDEVRIDANGGDLEARQTLKAVGDRIDTAARRNEIYPGILILLGRLFASSNLDIGEAARASMSRMVSADVFHQPGEEAYRTLVQPLLMSLEGDAFAVHEEIRSMVAIFPPHYRAALVEALAIDANTRGRNSAVGFLIDPDETVALAAVRGLAASAALGALDADCRRRIDMIRDWLPRGSREALDAAVPAATSAVSRPSGELLKTIVSACDGSGAAALLAILKRGARYSIVAVLTKPVGVADSFVLEDLPKSEVKALERRYTASAPASEVSLASWARLVRLALGRNMARGAPPPFALVRALDAIGLASLAPEPATPRDIIEMALAGVADRESSAAIGHAHQSVADSDVSENWFEAGDAVDAILKPTNSIEEGAQALIESYLPSRRNFWASQCALSALALKESQASRGAFWKDLALVGRELLRDVPMTDIPLMRQIADRSATAYFLQH